MSPVIIRSRSERVVCNISRVHIGMVQAVVDHARWKINSRIQVGWIEEAKCILLGPASKNEGFQLVYSNRKWKTGGRINCRAFIQNILQTLVELPLKNIPPVFLKGRVWSIALLLEEVDWSVEEFSKAGCNKISGKPIGVYELLGRNDAVLRVGEGKIKERLNIHLRDRRFAPPTVQSFRYLALREPDDGKLLERILIEQFESETGTLPRFQEIRA